MNKVVNEINKSFKKGRFYFRASDGAKLFIHVTGKGSPCLIFNGSAGTWEENEKQLEPIRQKFMTITFDVRGSGLSSSSHDYSPERIVKDIEEIRHFLGIKKWSIAVHLFGGYISTLYAKSCANYISSLIFIDCPLTTIGAVKFSLQENMGTIGIMDHKLFQHAARNLASQMEIRQKNEESDRHSKYLFRSVIEKPFNDCMWNRAKKFNRDYFVHIWSDPTYWKEVITKDISCPVILVLNKIANYKNYFERYYFPNKKIVFSLSEIFENKKHELRVKYLVPGIQPEIKIFDYSY